MFELRSRVSSLTYNEEARTAINENLQAYQEKCGHVFSSVKELFEHLLSNALTSESPEPKEVIKEVIPENAMILPEGNESNEFIQNMNQLKMNSPELAEDSNMFTVLAFAVQSALKSPETIEIEKVVEKEVEKSLESNEYIIAFTDEPGKPIEKKKVLLDEIQKRRARKFGQEEPLEILMEKMIFNDNIIFNLGGEFYTGF